VGKLDRDKKKPKPPDDVDPIGPWMMEHQADTQAQETSYSPPGVQEEAEMAQSVEESPQPQPSN
jgi:hypothetical protein